MFCMMCRYGGEAAETCPRCGASGLYLLDIPALAQGAAYRPNELELARDEEGFTNPNLHRRTADHSEDTVLQELRIYGTNSYRFSHTDTHDEESTTSEIP